MMILVDFRKKSSEKNDAFRYLVPYLSGISILCFANKQIEVGIFPLIVAAIVLAIFIATKPTLESVKEELADTVFYNMRLRPTMDVGEIVKAVIAMKMAK